MGFSALGFSDTLPQLTVELEPAPDPSWMLEHLQGQLGTDSGFSMAESGFFWDKIR